MRWCRSRSAIIAATEATARQLKSDEAKELRKWGPSAKHTFPRAIWTKKMHRAIKELRKDTDIVILPVDKGNATVVMDRAEYVPKMNLMLEDKAYTRLKKDPTSKVELKINRALKSLENDGYIGDEEIPFASVFHTTTNVRSPQDPQECHTLVSNCLTNLLSHLLPCKEILSPLRGETESHVKNSLASV